MSALTLLPARYRKGHSVIQCASDGSGFKTHLMHALEKLGGKWVHRSRGYVLPEKKAKRVFAILQRLERMEQRRFVAKSGGIDGAKAPQRGPGEPFITPGSPSCPVCGNPIADCPCDPRDIGFTPLSCL